MAEKIVQIRMEESLHKRLKAAALQVGMPMYRCIFQAIREWVEKTEDTDKAKPPSLEPYGYRALTKNTQTGEEDTDA